MSSISECVANLSIPDYEGWCSEALKLQIHIGPNRDFDEAGAFAARRCGLAVPFWPRPPGVRWGRACGARRASNPRQTRRFERRAPHRLRPEAAGPIHLRGAQEERVDAPRD